MSRLRPAEKEFEMYSLIKILVSTLTGAAWAIFTFIVMNYFFKESPVNNYIFIGALAGALGASIASIASMGEE